MTNNPDTRLALRTEVLARLRPGAWVLQPEAWLCLDESGGPMPWAWNLGQDIRRMLKPHAWVLRPESWLRIPEAWAMVPEVFPLATPNSQRPACQALRPEAWQSSADGQEILAELRALDGMEPERKALYPEAWGPKPEGMVFDSVDWALKPRILEALRPGVWMLAPSAWEPRAAIPVEPKLERSQTVSTAADMARKRHAEHRDIKEEARAYWLREIDPEVPATDAAKLLAKIAPMKESTYVRWVREWLREFAQTARKPAPKGRQQLRKV